MITGEAINLETNRTSVAGPKRVGRFQLFGDALTKFYEQCVNTVVERDDLPKTEVQVSSPTSRTTSKKNFFIFLPNIFLKALEKKSLRDQKFNFTICLLFIKKTFSLSKINLTNVKNSFIGNLRVSCKQQTFSLPHCAP